MDIREGNGDEKAIRALIGAHFQGLKWTPTTRADWATFSADFLPDASLFPAARPARAKTLDAFIERMNGVAQGSLRSFEERTLGMQVLSLRQCGGSPGRIRAGGERDGSEP